MIPSHKGFFHTGPALWIPPQDDHLCQIVRSKTDAPFMPINDADPVVGWIAGMEKVPSMGVSVD
jgi:hypothetical protein